ncbi:hypothetical protein CPAV1605_1422 [seawater metagenome]|uniref:RING-CH-type domain-containing protein n=1 Tax=seawater metagenome TaxID=1561972 RepID=A0A5E8CKQ3_9ZZZZ
MSEDNSVCPICLESSPKKIIVCLCSKNEELEPIHCRCTGYCHRTCVIEHIKANNLNQKCILCNFNEYSPRYNINHAYKSSCFNYLLQFIIFFKETYNMLIKLILSYFFLLICGFLIQGIRAIENQKTSFIDEKSFYMDSILGLFFIMIFFLCMDGREKKDIIGIITSFYELIKLKF